MLRARKTKQKNIICPLTNPQLYNRAKLSDPARLPIRQIS